MLDKQKGDFIFLCDGCESATIETGTGNFDAAINMMRREKWKSHKRDDDEEWKHFCPACQFRRK